MFSRAAAIPSSYSRWIAGVKGSGSRGPPDDDPCDFPLSRRSDLERVRGRVGVDDAAIGKNTHQETGLENDGHVHLSERVAKLGGHVVRHEIIHVVSRRQPSLDDGVRLDDFVIESDPRDRTIRGRSRARASDGKAQVPPRSLRPEDGSASRVRPNAPRHPQAGLVARADHALEGAGSVKELVGAVAQVAHDRGSVPQHREGDRSDELAGTSTPRAELAQEAARDVEHQNPQIPGTSEIAGPVEHVQIALGVEGHLVDLAEHLPGLAVEDADPVDLLEVGFDPLVLPRQLDDLLGREGGGGKCEREDRWRDRVQAGRFHSGCLLRAGWLKVLLRGPKLSFAPTLAVLRVTILDLDSLPVRLVVWRHSSSMPAEQRCVE